MDRVDLKHAAHPEHVAGCAIEGMKERSMKHWTLAALLTLLTAPVFAAGSVTLRSRTTDTEAGVKPYVYTWTSDASGAVSGDTTTMTSPGGRLVQIALTPSGSAQPSDLYDVTLLNERGVDVLGGLGANLSHSAATEATGLDIIVDKTATLQLAVAHAGNVKSGTIVLWFRTQ